MKRFTETDKWRDAWFSELSFKAKMVWVYITDTCDNAGVWDPNKRLAEFSIGTKIEWPEIERELNGKVIVLPNGKWWIPSFVMFQYGVLSPNAQIHRSVVAKIESHGLSQRYEEWLARRISCQPDPIAIPSQSHDEGMPIPTGIGTGTVKVQKDRKETTVPAEPEGFSEAFALVWEEYVTYRKDRKLKALLPASIKAQFAKFLEWGEAKSIEAIRDTIRNSWQGIFEPKTTSKPANEPPKQSVHDTLWEIALNQKARREAEAKERAAAQAS